MTDESNFKTLQKQKEKALNTSNKTYDELLKGNNAITDSVNDYINQYSTTQSEIYDKNLAREQEKADLGKKQAEEEFNKEAIASKNAYYDFTNPYGVQRELQAQQGLGNSGYSETVKSQAWTAQQNRTAQARATMNKAKLQFDEDMKDARLNNDVLKAQLALDTLKMKQDETLRSFNYKSDITQQRLANNQNLDSDYANRYNNIWNRIMTENQQKEDKRQFDEKMAYQKERDKVEDAKWEKEYNLSQQKIYSGNSGGGSITDGTVYFEDGTSFTPTGSSDDYETLKPLSNKTNGQKVTPKASLNPNVLSSDKARSFYKSLINQDLTPSQLTTLLTNAYPNTIDANDLKIITKLYGV